MKTTQSEKIMISICLICLVLGLVQHGLKGSKKQDEQKQPVAQVVAEKPKELIDPKTGAWIGGDMKPFVEFHHTSNFGKRKLNLTKSIAQQQAEARKTIYDKDAAHAPVDLFAVRENLKKKLIYNRGPDSTMTDEEAWEIIKSGQIPR